MRSRPCISGLGVTRGPVALRGVYGLHDYMGYAVGGWSLVTPPTRYRHQRNESNYGSLDRWSLLGDLSIKQLSKLWDHLLLLFLMVQSSFDGCL